MRSFLRRHYIVTNNCTVEIAYITVLYYQYQYKVIYLDKFVQTCLGYFSYNAALLSVSNKILSANTLFFILMCTTLKFRLSLSCIEVMNKALRQRIFNIKTKQNRASDCISRMNMRSRQFVFSNSTIATSINRSPYNMSVFVRYHL